MEPHAPPQVDALSVAALRAYGILHTAPERAFDDIAATAGAIAGTGRAAVLFDDHGRTWCKARTGDLPESWGAEGPGVAEAGAVPIETPDGIAVGRLAVFGPTPLGVAELAALGPLARLVTAVLELRPADAVAAAPVWGVVVIGSDGCLRDASPSVLDMLGRQDEDLRGADVFQLVHPDDVEPALLALSRTAAFAGEKVPLDVRLAHADGSWRLVEVTAEDRDDDGVDEVVLSVRQAGGRERADALVTGEARVLGMIGRGASLGDTLAELAGLVEDQVEGAECCVMLADDAGTVLRPAAAPRLPAPFVAALERLPVGPAAASCGTAAFRSQTVISDIDVDPAWDLLRHHARAQGIATCWSAPIVSFADGRSLGTVALYHRSSRRPRPEHTRLIELCASLAAVAVDRSRAEESLAHQATHDDLTGLPNRALFLDRLQQALLRERTGLAPVAVLFLDLDRFKVVNDSLGHEAGDALLVSVARRLEYLLRPGDTVARFGGDEFTVLCPGVADAHAAMKIAERLLEGLAEPLPLGDSEVVMTPSIGIALASRAGDRPETLLRDADAAMYRAKERGRNRVELFDELMRARAVERLETDKALHHALERGEFVLHYQPEVELATGSVVGAEALVRWNHPERGLVPPDVFIPIAEDSGFIVRLGEWVLGEACRQLLRWDETAACPDGFVVWVNVSAVQIAQGDFPDRVAGVLDATGVDPGRIGLEITESALMSDAAAANRCLAAVKALGLALAVDDFGTGYSSLGYLKRFPVDLVKIDRAFVGGLGRDRDDSSIVAAVVGLTHALGRRVVAEGVETAAQLDELTALGCDLAQGFLFGPPEPASQDLAWRCAG